ncbi:hypothetical protein B0O99DRAFT_463012, partial [Bisporella sp. PMI_857]
DIFFAQEATEDQRLLAQVQEIQRASQKHSCPEDNETTPWLKQTRWPDLFQDRPLDIIAATAQRPGSAVNEDHYLGHWQGKLLVSPLENEAKLRILMRAADQVFTQAEAMLSRTSYQLRCWLKSYHKGSFYPKAITLLLAKSSQISYFTVWKQFLCNIFRVFVCEPLQRKQIYNLKFHAKEVKMTKHILSLVQELEGKELEDQESNNEAIESGESEEEESDD